MQGMCKGLQEAQVQTQTIEANGLARGATATQSKASQPCASPVPYDARAAKGLLPPALPSLQSLTGRVLHEKGLGRWWGAGDGEGAEVVMETDCPRSYRSRLACPTLCLLLSLLVDVLGTVPSSLGCLLTASPSVCRMERESASHNCVE